MDDYNARLFLKSLELLNANLERIGDQLKEIDKSLELINQSIHDTAGDK